MPSKRPASRLYLPVALAVELNKHAKDPKARLAILMKYGRVARRRTMFFTCELANTRTEIRKLAKARKNRKEVHDKRLREARLAVPGSEAAGLLLDFYMRGTPPVAVELAPLEVDGPVGKVRAGNRKVSDADLGEDTRSEWDEPGGW